jgi:hypothetical protein
METKLMKQYREASPVNHGIQGAAVRNKDGQVELFTIGTDQTVWNFYPDSTSATGYRRADTELKGDFVAAGVDHGGSIVVLARSGNGVNFAVKYLVNGKWKWSPVTKATLALIPGSSAVHIRAIYARTIDGQLYVGVDGWVARPLAPSTECYQAVSQWNVNAGSFQPWNPGGGFWPQMNPSMASFWTRTAASTTPAFSTLIHPGGSNNTSSIYTIDVSGNQLEGVKQAKGQMPLTDGRSATVDIESPVDSFGRNKIFFVGDDGNLYQLIHPSRDEKWKMWLYYNLEPLSNNVSLTKVHAVHDHKGGTHLFCVTKDKDMYHLAPDASFPTGYPPLGLPLKPHVNWVTIARNDKGNIELFYAKDTADAPLIHGTLDQDTGDWEWQTVETQGAGSPAEIESDQTGNPDKIEEFISYSTDISFTDQAGALLVNAAVTVNASDRTAITVNGAAYSVDAFTSASLKTDGSGHLTITQQTSGLSVPDLWVHVDGLMPADEVLILEQYDNGRDDASLPRELKSIETRLKDMTGPDLADAKDASGQPLLKAAVRNDPNSTKSLANAFNSCMKLPSTQPNATLHPLISREGAWTGLHIKSMADALEHNRITPHADLPSWSLSFEESGVKYQTLTPAEAQRMMAEIVANALPASDADGTSWWSTIGDFLEALVEGFVDAVVKITKIVVDGVTATFNFVMKGVSYVFNAVVKLVQDSFDMIESILAAVYESVEKFFEKTFEWIGFLFNWGDILRTRDALSYTLTQGLQFVPLVASDIQGRVNSGFVKLDAAVKQAFTELKSQVASSSLGGFAESNKQSDPVFMHSAGNNFFMNGLVNNAGAAKVSSVSTVVLDAKPIDDFLAALGHFADNSEKKDEFTKLQNYMQTTGSKPDNIFTQLLSDLIDLTHQFVDALISGVHDLINNAFNALASIVQFIDGFLKDEWNIPLVSAFYRFITTDADHPKGSPLTLIDLLSLAIAIPGTTLFKILKGKAPFPKPESVNAFKDSFSAETMLANFKRNTSNADQGVVEPASLGDPLSDWKAGIACCTAMSELGYWLFSAALDVKPPELPSYPGEEILAKTTLGFECAASFFSFPWFPWSAPFAGLTWETTGGRANCAWMYETIVGALMIDGGTIIYAKKLPENWNNIGVGISLGYTVFNAVFAGMACKGASHLDQAVEILPLVPNIMKLGRLTFIVNGTRDISLLVVAGADALFGMVIAILTAVQGSQEASPAMLPAAQPAT